MSRKNQIRIVLLGDSKVGKSCFMDKESKSGTHVVTRPYVETTLDQIDEDVSIGATTHSVRFVDTGSKDHREFRELRRRMYRGSKVFILFYSIAEPATLQSIKRVWVPEVKKFADKAVPFYIVGTQSDVRDDTPRLAELAGRSLRPVARSDGEDMAEAVKANGFFEASAKTRVGRDQIVQAAVQAAVNGTKAIPGKCAVM